jgi:hypothetical protein
MRDGADEGHSKKEYREEVKKKSNTTIRITINFVVMCKHHKLFYVKSLLI